MKELKKLLALALAFSLFTVACDDEECGTDGGPECDGGMGGTPVVDMSPPDMGPAAPEYTFIHITDFSDEESDNGSGTGGVDICSVSATCEGGAVGLSVANFTPGTGTSDDHDDPAAALTVEAECDPGDNTHYVSLGREGSLILESDTAFVAGCTIEVDEYVGSTTESYSVEVCTDAAGAECSEVAGDFAMGGTGMLEF